MTTNNDRLRTAFYLRVSSDDQRDGYSTESQRLSCDRRRKREDNWDLYEIYADEGFSAYRDNSRKRSEFKRLMENSEAGKLDVIIVDRLDRWGRESSHAIECLKALPKMGVIFVSVREPYLDITTSAGRYNAGIGALNAEASSDTISDNVVDAFETKTSKGLAWGRSPYGYQMCDNRCPRKNPLHPYWHLHDVKAPAVLRMFELYDTGMHSTAGIADLLNADGYRTNGTEVDWPGFEIEGNPFTTHSVAYILKNLHYIGMIKEIKPKNVKPRGVKPKTKMRPGLHTPIVSKELFDRVQYRLKKNTVGRRNSGRRTKVPTMLTRVVKCYICGCDYQVVRQGSQKGPYLRMSPPVKGPDCICMNHSFISRHVEQDLDALLQNFELDSAWREEIEISLNKKSDAALVEKERKSILDDIRRVDHKFTVTKSIDTEEYDALYFELKNRLDSLEKPETDKLVKAGEALEHFGPIWRAATAAQKNALLHTIFVAINIDPESQRVHSLVPKDDFALPIRSMIERADLSLEEISQRKSRELEGKGGYVYQFSTNLLKIVFKRELLLAGLSDRIRDRRYQSCMTQEQLADRLGVSANTIAAWERGSAPPIDIIEDLADWFDEGSPDWAIKAEDIPSLGQHVKNHRMAWGLTQADLGERLGVSAATIGFCENGSRPSMQTIEKLGPWLAEKAPVRRAKQSIDAKFGKRIQKKRLLLGMSRTALGKHLGGDRKQVSRWEEGLGSPSKTNAVIVAEWLSNPEDYTLAQRIRDKRKILGMTQKDIAEVFGVTLVTIKAWEQGRHIPSQASFRRVLAWLSRDHLQKNPEEQPAFGLFVLPMKKKRGNLGISQFSMARILGVSKNRVYDWEAGAAVPSEASCEKIGNWLDSIENVDRSAASSVVSRWNLAGRMMSGDRAGSLTGRGVRFSIPNSGLGNRVGLIPSDTSSQLAEHISRESGPDNGHTSAGALIRLEHRGLLSGLGRIGAYSSGSRETVLSESP